MLFSTNLSTARRTGIFGYSVVGLGFLLMSSIGSVQKPTTKPDLRDEATRILKQAAAFYRYEVASHGGYVYYYSVDLKERWGEGPATRDIIFVQPPGTPTVGMAFLQAYKATGDNFYLDAARETAHALVAGQLQSGGWTQVIHFAPAKQMGNYRNRKGGSWNASSLDDGQTQAALQMLVLADQALHFQDDAIHETASFGLDALLKAQFANGGFPQIWRQPVELYPKLNARFPGYDWRTTGRIKNYWDYYTLNDGLAGSVADVLITAHQVYDDDKYKAALEKLGDFLVLAQMPEPQPGWCQQYNYDMVPIWARKFEPPAISGWESQDVMETLIRIARHTGNAKFLEPIPRALKYFRECLLPDKMVARYYEFGTNKPLYMDSQYQLTYNDAFAPEHYGWKQHSRFAEIEKEYLAIRNGDELPQLGSMVDMESEVRRIISEIDSEGRWISRYDGERLTGQPDFQPEFLFISSDVFSRNVQILSEYIKTHR